MKTLKSDQAVFSFGYIFRLDYNVHGYLIELGIGIGIVIVIGKIKEIKNKLINDKGSGYQKYCKSIKYLISRYII